MIKFFRKIRQNLLMENKTGKYFKYAIGEIFLVVIGILIALQLNNLNEQKDIHKKQEKHLRLVKGEMLNNLNELKRIDNIRLSVMEAERKIIGLIELDTISEKELSNLLRIITFNDLIIPIEDGALKEIISSGGLKDIKNDSIRQILASWEGRNTLLRAQEVQLADTRNAIINILTTTGSIRTLIDSKTFADRINIDIPMSFVSNKSMLKSTAFENVVLHHMLLADYLGLNNYPKLESEILLLIKLIDKELSLTQKEITKG